MNIRLIKKMDAVIGCMAASLLPLPVRREVPSPVRSILIIRPGGIGDAVLLGPVIRHIRHNYPAVHITILAERRNAEIFNLIPGVARLFCYDRPHELLEVLRGSYDVVIDTEQWHRLSAVVARLAAAPVKIGFNTNLRRRMFTHTVTYSHEEYETTSFMHLLGPLAIEVAPAERGSRFLSVPADVSKTAVNLLESFQDEPFVALFPGASIPERRWGAGRFRRVAELLAACGIRVAVVGGTDERCAGDEIVAGLNGLNLAGAASLSVTAAVILRSSLLLSGDSGVLHMAVGLGKPTVSLFGPGRAKKWAPVGERHIVINKELPCSPCTTYGTTPPCPINAQCMRDIQPDAVFNAVTILLTDLGSLTRLCCKRDWIETV